MSQNASKMRNEIFEEFKKAEESPKVPEKETESLKSYESELAGRTIGTVWSLCVICS